MKIEVQVEWQNAVSRVLAGLTDGLALTHRELLEYVVRFTNGAEPEGPLACASDIPLAPSVLPAIDRETGKPREPSHHLEEFLAAHRAQMRVNLPRALGSGFSGAQIEGLSREASRMLDPIRSYELVITRTHRRKSGIRHLRTKRVFVRYTLGAILAYTVLHLLDETLWHGHDLTECHLKGCDKNRFFFAQSKTRPQLYCCPEHRAEGNRLSTRENMRALRRAAKHK